MDVGRGEPGSRHLRPPRASPWIRRSKSKKIDRDAPTPYRVVLKLLTLPNGSEAVVPVKVYAPVCPEPPLDLELADGRRFLLRHRLPPQQ